MDFNFNMAEDSKDPLKEYGRNLTEEAMRGKLDPVIGRDDEIRRVIRILSRKTKNNPVLVGDPGVGKTAIAEGLAQKILAGDVPDNLKDKEIIEIDMSSILAGASYQGQFEKRLKLLLKKIKDSNGEIIVFMDEIHTIVGAGKNSQGGMDAAQIFKPMLARGEISLIGATTFDEYKKYIEQDSALERRFQKIIVEEPTQNETIAILRGLKERFENFHGVKIQDNALISAVKLSERYITERFLPDKAIDLIDEAAANIKTEMHSKPEELEKMQNALTILHMEKAALSKEKNQKSKDRLEKILPLIKEEEKLVKVLNDKWVDERALVKEITTKKELIDTLKLQLAKFQNLGEYEKASTLLYKEIPELEEQVATLNEQSMKRKDSLVKEEVTDLEIAEVISKWTHIPINKLMESQKEKLLSLETNLLKRIKGQNNAVHLVSQSILRSRADINDPNRPIGSFIFMGPTGVGKTELTKALAVELFDSEKHLVRLDMSEYMEKHSVSKIIGSPPGYVGFDQGGQLTNVIRNKPYSIVLFDEIEKAHPDVLNVLLQILDDGQITDSKGKKVNFKNTIIAMTTNIGSMDVLSGKSGDDVEVLLRKFLRPEFINRIDETIVFEPLGKDSIKEIVRYELSLLENRLKEKDKEVSFDETSINVIVEKSYDPVYGARPIKRYIQKNIESVLANDILSNKIKSGFKYNCSYKDDKFYFYSKEYN